MGLSDIGHHFQRPPPPKANSPSSSDCLIPLPARRAFRQPPPLASTRRIEDGGAKDVEGSSRNSAVRTQIGMVELRDGDVGDEVVRDGIRGLAKGMRVDGGMSSTPFSVESPHFEGAKSMMTGSSQTIVINLEGVEYTVSGPCATLLANELERSHRVPHQRIRRRRVVYAGLINLAVLGLSIWILVEVVLALVRNGGKGRDVVRWIELGVGIGSLVTSLGVIPWLRTRRPNLLALFIIPLASLFTLSHLLLSITNLILVQTNHLELSQRCKWGLSVTWSSGPSSRICPTSSTRTAKDWTSAALIRLVVTCSVGGAWLGGLWGFQRCLYRRSSIFRVHGGDEENRGDYEKGLKLSNEAQALLAHKGASVQRRLDAQVSRTLRAPSSHPDHLLHMPELGQWRSNGQVEVEDDCEEAQPRSYANSMLGIWLGAKLLGWVSSSMGWDSFAERKGNEVGNGVKSDDREVEKRLVVGNEGKEEKALSRARESCHLPLKVDTR